MAARRDYENARKNASRENTKVGDDEGYLNQQLNMDWDWLRSSSGVGPFSLTGTSRSPDFELPYASQIRAASRLLGVSSLPFPGCEKREAATMFAEGRGYRGAKMPLRKFPVGRACYFQDALWSE